MTSHRERKLRALLDEHCVVDLDRYDVRDDTESFFARLLPYAVGFELQEGKEHIVDGVLEYLRKNGARCLYWRWGYGGLGLSIRFEKEDKMASAILMLRIVSDHMEYF